jgi:hypothetical protein
MAVIRGRRLAFRRIAEAALSNSETIVTRWLPDGRREGREWVAINPTRSDAKKGSFKVNLNTGAWSDFATGGAGGAMLGVDPYEQ